MQRGRRTLSPDGDRWIAGRKPNLEGDDRGYALSDELNLAVALIGR